MEGLLVSVIVNTKNCSEQLDVCLASVKNQNYPNVEIIIVDNNSTDNTKEVARKYTEKVYNKGPERSTQKNFGMKIAKGEFVLLVDNDQELPENLIEECVKEAEKGYDAIHIEDHGIGLTFWSRANAFEKAIHFNDRKVTFPRFVNRQKILEIGGFDEKLVFNEDIDLHMRMEERGFRIGHADVLFNHYEGYSLFDIIKKSFYYGSTAGAYFKKNPSQGAKLYLLYHPWIYIKNWRYFLKHPIYGSASIFRKFINYAAGGCGLIYSYLKNNLKLQIARSVGDSHPSYLIFFITSKCNSRCKYCFYWKELNQVKNELRLKEIEKITKCFKNLLYVSLTGGEPFLREDIDKIAFYFYKNSGTKFIAIPTNGILCEKIKEKVMSILELCPKVHLNIEISIDALGELHDEIRGVRGNFYRVLKTLKYLEGIKKKNPNLRIIIHSVFSAYNQDHVKRLYDFVRGYDIDQFRIGLIRKDSKFSDSTKIDLKKYNDFVDYIEKNKKIGKGLYSKLFYVINIMNREVNLKTLKKNKMVLPCVAGKKMLVIGEEGEVYPCEMLNKSFGNIRDYNYEVSRLLKSKKGKDLRNFIVKSKCFCTWGCATQNNIIFNPRTYPKIVYNLMRA